MLEAKVGSRAVTMSVVFVMFACGGGGGTSEPVAPAPTAPTARSGGCGRHGITSHRSGRCALATTEYSMTLTKLAGWSTFAA